jgi:hypothetical protein
MLLASLMGNGNKKTSYDLFALDDLFFFVLSLYDYTIK